MAEIGTDDARTLFAQIQSVKDMLKPIVDNAGYVPGKVDDIHASATAIEEVVKNCNNLLNSVVVNVDNIAETSVLVSGKADDISRAQTATHEQVIGNTGLLSTAVDEINEYKAWITPLLDDFSKTAILPTMQGIAGKVDELLSSHAEIKTLVEQIKEQVNPLIDRVSKSPILSMLGVKS